MGEDKQPETEPSPPRTENKPAFLSWLNTIPGIITAITSLLIAITGFYTALNKSGVLNKKSDDSVAKLPEQTTFDVEAKETSGHTYVYTGEKPAKLDYLAAGNWTAIPMGTLEAVATGERDANGYSGFAANTTLMPCPNVNLGALVVRKVGGICITGGTKGSLDAG